MDGLGTFGLDNVEDEVDHRTGDGKSGDEDGDAGGIRYEELRADAPFGGFEGDQFAIAEGGGTGEDEGLGLDGASQEGVIGGFFREADAIGETTDAIE